MFKSNKKSSRKKSKKSSKKQSKRISKGGSLTEYQEKIEDFIEKLDKTLKEKKLTSFWVFPYKKGFTKHIMSDTRLEYDIIKKDLDKYKGKRAADVTIMTFSKRKKNMDRDTKIYIILSIKIFKINDKGNLISESTSTTTNWKEEDFKTSKITMKLIEHLTKLTYKEDITTGGLFGIPFTYVINKLHKKNIEIDDLLEPL